MNLLWWLWKVSRSRDFFFLFCNWRCKCYTLNVNWFAETASSETQGQLVGSIKCPFRKFTVRSRRAPGHLLLLNQFQKRLNCPLLIGRKKIFLWPISEDEQPGDSDVFLHDVVFLIHRVARSTGKVLEESLRTNVNETWKISSFNKATRNKRSTMKFYGGSVEGIVNFDTRSATFTFYTFMLITSKLLHSSLFRFPFYLEHAG